VLRKFLLPHADDVELGIEHDRSRRGRALINGENVGAHAAVLPPPALANVLPRASRGLAGTTFWLMVTPMRWSNTPDQALVEAVKIYRQKRYAEAEVLVDRILATAPRHAGVGPAARGY
jgi:hypothetical protein